MPNFSRHNGKIRNLIVLIVKLVTGGSGGTRITSATADVAIRALLFDKELNGGKL